MDPALLIILRKLTCSGASQWNLATLFLISASDVNRRALRQPLLDSGRVKFSIPAWQLAKEWCADSEDRYRIHAKA
jgi:hypothetical protein